MSISTEVFVLKGGGGKYLPRYFNLSHSKVGNVNINQTPLTFFVFDPVDAMYASAYLYLYLLYGIYSEACNKSITGFIISLFPERLI
jgi:hypothetical protein